MAKTPADIRSLARSHTDSALRTLANIMVNDEAPPAARVSAAQALLDRGWGKAAQTVDMTVKRATAKELPDDELANIAAGGSEDTASAPLDPALLN
ncbi:MAG: hypothetical protein WC100_12120 [Sterolibacterium sp.]